MLSLLDQIGDIITYRVIKSMELKEMSYDAVVKQAEKMFFMEKIAHAILVIPTAYFSFLIFPPLAILPAAVSMMRLRYATKFYRKHPYAYYLYMNKKKLKALGIELPSSVDDVPSITFNRQSQFRYTTISEASSIFSKDENKIYIGNFQMSKETRAIYDYLTVKTGKYIPLPEIYFTHQDLTKSMVVLGKMGSGKSVFLKNLLAQEKYNRAIINDVKGEYVEAFYTPNDLIFNIYDERSHIWNMFDDIQRNPALADVIANSITAQLSEQEKDFWQTAAAKLLKDALLSAAFDDIDTSQRFEKVIGFINQYRAKAVEEDDRTALSVYATLQPVLDSLELLAYLTKSHQNYFSAHEFAEARRKKLFLVNTVSQQKAQAPLFAAFLSTLISVLLSRPDTKEDFTLFLLDEFLNIKIPNEVLIPLFTVSRSKGIQLVFAAQFLPDRSKSDTRTQLILSSRHALVVFKLTDENTLSTLENSFGNYEFITTSIQDSISLSKTELLDLFSNRNRTISISHSDQRAEKKVLDRNIIFNLPDYTALVSTSDPFSLFMMRVEKFYYQLDRKIAQPFIQRDLRGFYLFNMRPAQEENPWA